MGREFTTKSPGHRRSALPADAGRVVIARAVLRRIDHGLEPDAAAFARIYPSAPGMGIKYHDRQTSGRGHDDHALRQPDP
jgi:hypothetical protein